jgi:hypothetical protein
MVTRLNLPGLPSQRTLFRQQFMNLSYVLGMGGIVVGTATFDWGADLSGGGYIKFGSSLAYQNKWTVVADVLVPDIGFQRAILTCGHSAIGTRFELGVDATGHMYATGTTTVASTGVVPTGRHELMWQYTDEGILEFYVDGILDSLIGFTLGSAQAPQVLVGVAADGASRKWGSTIYDLSVHSDYVETPWTLADALGDNGMWLVGDYGVQSAPQPDALVPIVGAITGGVGSEPSPGIMRCTTDGSTTTATALYAPGYVGCRLLFACPVRGDGDAQSRAWNGTDSYWNDGVAVGVNWESRSGDATSTAANQVRLVARFTPATAGKWVEFDLNNQLLQNISVTSHAPKAATGALAGSSMIQATPGSMPWQPETLLNGHKVLRFDAGADHYLSNASAAAHSYHKAAGFTCSFLVKPEADGVTSYILRTCSPAAANTGVTLYRAGSNSLLIYVWNGGGLSSAITYISPNFTVANGWRAVTMSWNEADGLHILIDNAAMVITPTTGAVSDGDADATLLVGYSVDQKASVFIRVGAVDDAELARIHAAQMVYGGL